METILKKTKFHKVFAILMAMFFALSLSLTGVHAISQQDKVKVNVQLAEGDEVAIYKIIDVNYDFETDQPKDPMYIWNSNIATWLKGNNKYKGYVADNNAVSESFKADQNNPEAFQGLLQQLAAALKTNKIENVDTTTEVSSTLGMGEYLIVGKSNHSGTVYLPTTITVVPQFIEDNPSYWKLVVKTMEGILDPNQGSDTYAVNLKGSTLKFDKAIHATGEALNDMQTVGVGNTVNYVLTATLPTYPLDAVNKTLIIEDTAGSGLTLPTAEGIKVYSDQGLQDELKTGFTKLVEGQKLTVNFDYDTLVQNSVSTVYITYTATVNGNAPIVDALKNTATFTFAQDPYQANANGQITDHEIVYTYALNITKVAEDQTSVLTGAQFTLKENNTELSFVKNTDGSYRLAVATEPNTTKGLEVNAQGNLVIQGLDTGTYTLMETKAANGMILPKNPEITMTLADDNPDGTLDKGEIQSSIVPITDPNKPTITGNTLSFRVVNSNKANFELPNTGGMGTLMFTVGGMFLMVGAVIYLIVTRKKV